MSYPNAEVQPMPQIELPGGNGLISAAFVKAQAEMPIVKFDSGNPAFKSRYASLSAIIGETRPILGKNGLAMEQIARIHDGFVTVSTKLRHASGQTLDFGEMTMGIGESRLTEAQAAGSLITYLRRYSWQTALGIAADEDDDGNKAPTKQPAAIKPAEVPRMATPIYRMRALNQLQAAPGQPNRDTVIAYLNHRGWLELTNDPDNGWNLDRVPTTKEELSKLAAEIQEFDVARHQPATTEELI